MLIGALSFGFAEQVWEHWLRADLRGKVPVAIVNRRFDHGRGIGLLVEVNKQEFPCQFEWQNFQEWLYTIGIEPSTNHVLGKNFARERSELITLGHGEERECRTRFAVLDGVEEIASVQARIEGIAQAPQEEFPQPSQKWEPLGPNSPKARSG